MIKKIRNLLGMILRALACFCDGMREPAHPIPASQSDDGERLRFLLSKDDLSEEERKELAELAGRFESVIFLDGPVHPAKGRL